MNMTWHNLQIFPILGVNLAFKSLISLQVTESFKTPETSSMFQSPLPLFNQPFNLWHFLLINPLLFSPFFIQIKFFNGFHKNWNLSSPGCVRCASLSKTVINRLPQLINGNFINFSINSIEIQIDNWNLLRGSIISHEIHPSR